MIGILKKLIVVTLVVAGCLFAVNLNNDEPFSTLLWNLTHSDVLQWGGVSVHYGDDMWYKLSKTGESVAIIPWDESVEGGLGIYKLVLGTKKRAFGILKKEKDNIEMLEIGDASQFENVIYSVARYKSDNEYVYSYHLIGRGVGIAYTGQKSGYVGLKDRLLQYVAENAAPVD